MGAFRIRPSLKVLIAFMTALAMFASQVVAQPLTNEQKTALRDYFNTNAKISSFGGKVLTLMDQDKFKGFFEKYGNALLVVRIGNELLNAKTWEATKLVFSKAGDVAIKKLGTLDPALGTFASGFSWFGWAKTGMELAKILVVDPAKVKYAIDMYASNRANGLPPTDSTANALFFEMRTMATKEFMRIHKSELQLMPGSRDMMTPEWEAKLSEFTEQWMEDLYQQRLAEAAKQALLAKLEEAKQEVAGLDENLIKMLEAEPTQTGSTGGPVSESIAVLLDASGSMADEGRMDAAKASAKQVIGQMKGNVEVALIAFFECGDIRTVAAFTTDPNEILKALEPIQPSGGTPLAEGIGIAKEYLRANANSANKRLVVLTDGAESCQGDLVGAARK